MDANVEKTPYDVKSATKVFSRIGFALIAFYAATYATLLALEFFLLYGLKIENFSSTLSVLLSSVSMYGVGFPVCFLVLRRLQRTPPSVGKARFSTLAVLVAIAFAGMYFGNLLGISVSAMLENLLGFGLAETTLDIVTHLPWYVAFGFAVVVGPLVEECIFRKLIIDRTRVYGEKLSILFSALLFAFFHMSVQQFFYAFFIGLVLGYLYMRTGSLGAVWFVHATINFFGSVVPLILMQHCGYEELLLSIQQGSDAMIEHVTANPVGFAAVMLYSFFNMALVILGSVLCGRYLRKLHFEKAEKTLPRDSEATVAFTGIGVILFIAVCVILPVLLSYIG